MKTWVTRFEPQPTAAELVGAVPLPFAPRGPAALARRAAAVMQAELAQGIIAPGLASAALFIPESGKMFGVLVVKQPDGDIGFLRSFSGMLAGRWEVAGFVPPVFDAAARARIEPAGEAVVKELLARAAVLRNCPELAALRVARAALQTRHRAEQAELRTRHDESKQRRHAQRAALTTARALAESERRAALHTLAQESRGDKAEARRLEARQSAERADIEPHWTRLERRLRAHERLRRLVCRALMKRIHDTYQIKSARGERRPLRALFAPGEPPSGAADCAGPKLLAMPRRTAYSPLRWPSFGGVRRRPREDEAPALFIPRAGTSADRFYRSCWKDSLLL